MLSIPYSPPPSFASSSISNSFTISFNAIFFFNLADTHSFICSLLFTYQIPSQPIMIKSTFLLSITFISGLAVIICYSAEI